MKNNLLKYLTKRLFISVVIIWGVLTITFFLMHLTPGDPSSVYINPEIDPKVVSNIRHQMGLDLPLSLQYLSWLRESLSGNFGISFMHKRPVKDVLIDSIPNTFQLTFLVFIIQLFFGITLGVFMAVKRNSKLDYSLSTFLLFMYSIPGFWLALTVILIFSLKLGWFPSGQMNSIGIDDEFWTYLFDRIHHIILPATVLSIPFIAYTSRFVRGSLAEVLTQDYMVTTRAYGLSQKKMLFKYALKNALLPLITLAGLYIPFLFGGAVITEYIFSWPGMGRITIEAIFAHDFPVILATNAIAAITVVIGNLISDILYRIADPRIKYSVT